MTTDTIQFEDHGAGTPVVLLHAFPLSSKMWEPQKEALRGENIRLILPDLRGFGETRIQSEVSSMEEMARDVADLLDVLEVEKAIIGGLSMGGYVTFAFFRQRPDLFSAMILCDTTCAADTKEKREKRFGLIEKVEATGSRALIEGMLPVLVGDSTKKNNGDLVRELERIFAAVEPRAAIAALRGMASRSDSTDLLPTIEVPTLFVFGEEDALTEIEIGREMHRQVRGSELCVVRQAGHYSNLEQPERFNKELVSFIRSHYECK